MKPTKLSYEEKNLKIFYILKKEMSLSLLCSLLLLSIQFLYHLLLI